MNKYQAQQAIADAEKQMKQGNCNKGLVSARAHAILKLPKLFTDREQKLIGRRLDRLSGFKQEK